MIFFFVAVFMRFGILQLSHGECLMSLDLLTTAQDPRADSADLTYHLNYCFSQLASLSPFTLSPENRQMCLQAIAAIVVNPQWNYSFSLAQLSAMFDPRLGKSMTSAQMEGASAAFDVFLGAMRPDHLEKTLREHRPLLAYAARGIPWVQAEILKQEIAPVLVGPVASVRKM